MSEEGESKKGSFVSGSTYGGMERFELNLAPVIDCLTVLIVYTMISASFITMGVFDTTVPTEGRSSPSTAQVQLRLDLNSDKSIEVTIEGNEKFNRRIASVGGDWNFEKLSMELSSVKEKWSGLNTATVAADPSVHYREIVRLIERTKKTVPYVVLGE